MRFIHTITCAALLAAAHAGATGLSLDRDNAKAAGAGFQSMQIPRPNGAPIQVDVWYPSLVPPAKQHMGVITQEVAIDAEVEGKKLPLIVFSHGTGGSGRSHYDTALALANAGCRCRFNASWR